MQSMTNHDIWSEILRYFEVNLADDSREDIRLKRRAILSVAMTHPDLVDVALDELWRSMESLEPIVRVLNALEPTDILVYNRFMDFWVSDSSLSASSSILNLFAKEISVPVNRINPFSRARLYLSRIQHLHFATFPTQKECTLWTAISNLGQLSPLCPSLRKILLGSGFDPPGAIYNLTLLISPVLQSVVFANTISDESTIAAIPTLLSSFRCHNVQLHEISYRGHVSPRVVQLIFEFPTLRSVAIQPNQPNLGSVDIQRFRGMENLTKLDIHLGIFQANASVGDWLTHMPSLLTLRLSGLWKDISLCIHDRTYGSLQSLSLFLDPSTMPRGLRPPAQQMFVMNRDVFSRISAAFPQLKSLRLTLQGRQPSHAVMTILDILALRERPLETLELRHLPASLSTTDVIDILTVWPSLRHLCIVPSTGHYFNCEAKVVLSYTSNHAPKLQSIDLPLDFLPLTTPLLEIPRCICPLQKLELSQALGLPEILPEKLTFCRNLISLLPRLNIVTFPEPNSDVSDLQAILNLVQDILSSPPKRQDHLF